VRDWIQERFEEILYECGWPLLEAGKEREKENIRFRISRSLELLSRLLSEAEVKTLATEYEKEADLGNIRVTGRVDLYGAGGPEPVLIDFKWGNMDERRKEIAEGRDMQLALYALLVDAVEQNPNTAYLIASRTVALTHEGARFSSAIVPENSRPTSEVYPPLLEAIEEAAKYRYGQLEQGVVYLSPEDVEDELPSGVLKLPEKAHGYDEYANLLGWSGR
jgi:hypothetical protein